MALNGANNAAGKEPPSMALLYRRQLSEFFSPRPAFTTKEPKKPEDFNTISYGDSGDSGLYLLA